MICLTCQCGSGKNKILTIGPSIKRGRFFWCDLICYRDFKGFAS